MLRQNLEHEACSRTNEDVVREHVPLPIVSSRSAIFTPHPYLFARILRRIRKSPSSRRWQVMSKTVEEQKNNVLKVSQPTHYNYHIWVQFFRAYTDHTWTVHNSCILSISPILQMITNNNMRRARTELEQTAPMTSVHAHCYLPLTWSVSPIEPSVPMCCWC